MTYEAMGTRLLRGLVVLAAVAGAHSPAAAQTSVVLPGASELTTLTATVSDQATVSVPSVASFAVTNVGADTAVNNLAVSVSQIVLTTASKQVRISVQANAAAFTPPSGASATWAASDLSWSFTSGSPWTGGLGVSGTLSHLAYNTAATCNAGVVSCSTTRLKLTLAAKPTITRAGAYTLVITCKVESI